MGTSSLITTRNKQSWERVHVQLVDQVHERALEMLCLCWILIKLLCRWELQVTGGSLEVSF